MKQLKQCLKEEQERCTAAYRAAAQNRSAPIANVRGIFDEGHRFVEAKMKIKVGYEVFDPFNQIWWLLVVLYASKN